MTQQSSDSANESPLMKPDSAARAETGAAVIARHAKLAPAGPGVYRMFDSEGQVLYVGIHSFPTRRSSDLDRKSVV